uniref:zinc finger BED domain-containing protein RICESLEEPER 2-like n=1 Tax=Erigeron canadensis TaxID=72917 RepID=UPI001CB893B6|nr:zinc finger BED domain-containing protein RICESLEEPER 2-like [Erigeron canadensis]
MQDASPIIKNILLLDSEGKRVAVKYFSDDWPTNSAKLAFEKFVFAKTLKTNARTEAEIGMFENNVIVFRFMQDLHFFVTGGDDENELALATVLQGFFDAVTLLLRGNVDQREALENLDLIYLCLDEIVDGGMILETDGSMIAGKVVTHNIDEGSPLSEQMSEPDDFVEQDTIDLEDNENGNHLATGKNKTKIYKPRSWVWEHFNRSTVEGKLRAACAHCGDMYLCGTKNYGTSNLKNHLLFKCKVYKSGEGQTQIAFEKGDERKMIAHQFKQKAIKKALAHMIVVDEFPFSFVKNKGFRHYNSVSQPLFKIPCRSTMTIATYDLFLEEKEKVRDFIKRNIGRICLTTDGWTSTQQVNHICLTAHFIDNEWKLRKKVLSFKQLDSHKGVDIGKEIEQCLIDWKIENVFTISVDNASANDVAVNFLRNVLKSSNHCLLTGQYTHIRCVAHILNLVVQDGIKKVGKSIEKIRYAVRWIRQSGLRIKKFAEYAKIVKCDTTKNLIRDVPTRWNSTYNMLEVAQAYENTFQRYNLLDSEFGKDMTEAGFEMLTRDDWANARKLCHFLEIFYHVTLKVSGTHYVTSNTCMDDIASIRTHLNEALNDPSEVELCQIASAMKPKFDKYFGDVKKMNLLLYLSLILDPRNKKPYWGILLDDHYGMDGAEVVSEKKTYILEATGTLYNEYVRLHSPCSSSTTGSSTSSTILGKRSNPDVMEAKAPTRNKLREKMKTNTIESISELQKYLDESLEDDSSMFDILAWWKVNSPRFPTLSLMARDLFAIPVSTVASESVFSTSGRVLDPFRSSLTPMIVESLICTQDWLRTGSNVNPPVEEDWDNIQEIHKELETRIVGSSNVE